MTGMAVELVVGGIRWWRIGSDTWYCALGGCRVEIEANTYGEHGPHYVLRLPDGGARLLGAFLDTALEQAAEPVRKFAREAVDAAQASLAGAQQAAFAVGAYGGND